VTKRSSKHASVRPGTEAGTDLSQPIAHHLLPLPPMEPVAHSPMHEMVYDRIREAFTSGQMVPGQRIVIRDLARALGTSMMPVRDALRRLEAENAVVLTNGRTLAVPSLSAKDYEELCMIRVTLESLAAQEAAKNITEAELEELVRFADLVDEAAAAGDAAAASMHNRHFHWAVNAASHRPLLIRIIESLWLRVGPQIRHSVRFDIQGGDVRRSAFHPHRQVIAALRNGDGASAATAIAYDISRAGQIIVAHLKSIEGAAAPAEKLAIAGSVKDKSRARRGTAAVRPRTRKK
jgi:DNA-binding GntR family transcriptional regulator